MEAPDQQEESRLLPKYHFQQLRNMSQVQTEVLNEFDLTTQGQDMMIPQCVTVLTHLDAKSITRD